MLSMLYIKTQFSLSSLFSSVFSDQRVVMARGTETGEDDAGAVATGTSCSVGGERETDRCVQNRCNSHKRSLDGLKQQFWI